MSVRGHARTEKVIPVIGSKFNGREVIPVTGSKRKDGVSVRGNATIKRTIPVIGSKQSQLYLLIINQERHCHRH